MQNILHDDMKYMMSLRDKTTGKVLRIYDYFNLYCIQAYDGKLIECEYLLDSSFIEYLQTSYVSILNIREECIDRLMANMYQEIIKGIVGNDFILYNSKGVNKILRYCADHLFTRKKSQNRYVIHYLTHRVQRQRRY